MKRFFFLSWNPFSGLLTLPQKLMAVLGVLFTSQMILTLGISMLDMNVIMTGWWWKFWWKDNCFEPHCCTYKFCYCDLFMHAEWSKLLREMKDLPACCDIVLYVRNDHKVICTLKRSWKKYVNKLLVNQKAEENHHQCTFPQWHLSSWSRKECLITLLHRILGC